MPEKLTQPDKYEPIRKAVRALSDHEIQAILDARQGVQQEPGPIQFPSDEEYIRIQTAANERLRRKEKGEYNPGTPSQT